MNRTATLCLAICGLLVSSAGAGWAQDEPPPAKDYTDHWIPVFNIGLTLERYRGSGVINSNVGFSALGDGQETIADFDFAAELQTPALAGLPTEPRGFLTGGLRLHPSQTVLLAKAGAFQANEPESGVAGQLNQVPAPVPYRDPTQFAGQGSEMTATLDTLGWFAQVGFIIGLPKAESRFKTRAYFAYGGEQVTTVGLVTSVTGRPGNLPTSSPYVVHRPYVQDTATFHYIGPGAALEIVLVRTETQTFSFYGQFEYMFLLGDGVFTTTAPTNEASFVYTAEDSRARGGFGLRIAFNELFSD